MSKYNDVMKKVVVTDEMRSRILENIDKELREGAEETTATNENEKITDISSVKKNDETGNKIVRFIVRYGSRVAVFALILVGAYSVLRFAGMSNHSTMESATSVADEAAMSAEESYDSTGDAMEMETEATAYANEAYEMEAETADSISGAYEIEAEEADRMDEAESYAGTSDAAVADMDEYAESDNSGYELEEANEDIAAEESVKGMDAERNKATEAQKNELTANIGAVSRSEFVSVMGFDFSEPEALVREAEEITYYPGPDGGEIRYATKDEIIYYYVSLNASFTDEKILSESVFATTNIINVGDRTITLYGNDDIYNVATWNTDNICYAIVSDKGMTEENIRYWLE